MFSRNAFAAVAAVVLLAACAPANKPEDGMPVAGLITAAATDSNGIMTNGIMTNGIMTNGIMTNGIMTNGIMTNGIMTNGIMTNGLAPGVGTSGLAMEGLTESSLAKNEFHDWFAQNPSYADMVMRYVVKCALPVEETLSYDFDGASYAWPGGLGLAPRWAQGDAIGADEQELVSACLAAHTNGFGKHVIISVRGFKADAGSIDVTPEELAGWRFHEACFFGNLFDGAGVGVGLEPDSLQTDVSTPRGCAAEFGVPGNCSPMVQVGMCQDLCALGEDGQTYTSCTVNGRSYRPLQVFLQDSDVNHCGDGVCAFPEDPSNCAADCAPPDFCGNGSCGPTEGADTCPQDCATPAPADACGDGVCGPTESNATCPTDCP